MRLRPVDAVVVLLSLAAFSVAGLAFYRSMTDPGSDPNQPQVGVLSFKEGSAQRKYQGRVVWQEIQTLRPVFNLDSIRTNEDAAAVLTLKSGVEISLGASTLITLDIPAGGGSGSISFEAGSVSAKGGAAGAGGGAPLSIKSRDSVVTLGAGEVSVKAESSGVTVDVAKGSATVAVAGGAAQTVSENETATVAAGEAKPVLEANSIDITSPEGGAGFLAPGATVEVAFQWTSLRELPEYSLELSKKESMKPVAKKATATAKSAAVKLEPGVWYARVSGTEGGKPVRSAVTRVAVVADTRPRLVSPRPGDSTVFKGSGASVRFEWAGADKATGFIVEASTAGDFSGAVKGESAGKSLVLDGLGEGAWNWRVRPVYSFGAIGPQPPTAASSFSLARKAALDATRLLSPAEGDLVPEVSMRKSGIFFSWKPDPDADTSRFLLAKDRDFTAPLVDQVVPSSSYLSRAVLTPGTYYWKVEARAAGGLLAPATEPRSFGVTELSVVVTPTGPAPGAEFERGAVIPFAWKAANDAGGSYKLEIIRADGTAVSATDTKSRSLPLEAPPPGDYAWRLGFTDEFGVKRVATDPMPFAVLDPLPTAEPVAPAAAAEFRLVSEPVLNFSWKAVAGAEEYLFTLKNAEGTPLAEAPRLAQPSYSFAAVAKLRAGTYSWTVRAIQRKGGRERTSLMTAAFTLSDVINCPPAPPLAAPVALAPKKGDTVDMSKAPALVFKWKPVPGATRYKLAFYGKKDPDRAILSVDGLTAAEYRMTDLEKLDVGEFFWTLEAETVEKGIKTRASPALRTDFAISLGGGTLAAPEILSPEVQFGRD